VDSYLDLFTYCVYQLRDSRRDNSFGPEHRLEWVANRAANPKSSCNKGLVENRGKNGKRKTVGRCDSWQL